MTPCFTVTNRTREKRMLVIAICTRNRPAMLADCLSSVAALHTPSREDLAIVVVDNSETLNMRLSNQRVADTAFENRAFTILYEDRLGIPFARNRALEFAVDRGAEALVFLDDDQTVPPDWLEVMASVWREEGADAVKSSVCWRFEGEGRYREFFESQEPETGPDGRLRDLAELATNGVLIDRRIFAEWGLRFDPAYGLMGGDDANYFTKSHANGGKHVMTSETQACEFCPTSKQTLRWIFRREFRVGSAMAAIAMRNRGRAWLFAKGVRRVVRYAIAALALAPLPRLSLRYQLRATRGAGLCWGSLGGKVPEYRQVAGR